MEPTGLFIAIFISVVFFLKFVLAFLGFSDDFEAGEYDSYDFQWDDILSPKGLLNFMFGFSWSWACFGLNGWRWVIAVLIGISCVVMLGYIYYWLSKLEVESVNEELNNLKGRKGIVYSTYETSDSNPTSQRKIACEIMYNDKPEIMEVYIKDQVNIGDSVVVVEVLGNSIIFVKKV